MKILLVIIVLFSAPLLLWAEDSLLTPVAEQGQPATNMHTLSPVIVHATSLESGETRIEGADLEMMPSATGSITEALKGMSQIQYDDERQSSLTVGEIAPPRISISGAKPYENNFMIDGMGVTNTLNPSGLDDVRSATVLTVGGGDATIFYDTSLIESIQVYSSNISAQYGGFVGGVVDAKLREPVSDRWRFTLSGRYTEDSWFDLRDVDEESREPYEQPRFTTYQAGLIAEGPINDDASLLLSYSRHHSSIPLTRITSDGTEFKDSQKRTNENYFARLNLQPHNDMNINLDLTYAPYKALRWDYAFRDSEWYIENRSWRFSTQVDYSHSAGVITGKAALAQYGFSRDSKASFRYSGLDDKYGGLGDAENKTRETSASLGFASNDHYGENGYLNFSTGIDYRYKHMDMWNEGIEIYSVTATRRTVQTYEEISQTGYNSNLGAYGEFEVAWRRLLVRPGLRVDYDRFSGNIDVAPRFKSEYDLFGNSVMRLGVGVNRYYGQHLSAYAFNRYRPINTQIYDIQPDGSEVPRDPTLSTTKSYSSDGLSTPYSDEISGAISGFIFGFEYNLSALERKHKNQLISKTADGDFYYLTNDGKSEYREISFSIQRDIGLADLGFHRLSFNATKSKTNSFNDYYDSDVRSVRTLMGYDYNYNYVFYNGELISRSDMPAENYNSPWVLTLSTNSRFLNDHLRLYSVTRWRGSSKGLVSDKSDHTPFGTITGRASSFWINPDGGYSNAYKSGKISGGSTTDITTEFDAIKTDRYHLTLILEALNVFNGNMQTGIDNDAAGTGDIHGRGFYLGARMTF
ncbi:MAG: TonB-dependent receptor plug domain-containing protein [Pelovirga sp.]